MADRTPIEWTDATLNVVNGCDVVSPGCTNCYAMQSGARNLPGHPSTGLTRATKAGHVWTGEVRFNDEQLIKPLSWKRPRRIFWNAHGDLFHEDVPDAWIDRCFAVMALTPQHTHQVLTKRSARMRQYLTAPYPGQRWVDQINLTPGLFGEWDKPRACARVADALHPLPNVWLGVSVEDQARAGERIPDLLATPAAVRWISAEPLLGPVDLTNIRARGWDGTFDSLTIQAGAAGRVDWVVAGGESGPGARPMHPDWARNLRDQCAAAGVPFLFKQWGEWGPRDAIDATPFNLRDWESVRPDEGTAGPFYRFGKKRAGRLLDGVLHDGYPA